MSDDLQDGNPVEQEVDSGTAEAKPDQDAVQKVINKKHYEAREAERQRDAEIEKRKALEERLAALEKPQDIPPMPDPYDDNFEQRIREREAAIAKKAEIEAQQRLQQDQQEMAQEQAQKEALEAQQKVVADYANRAVDLGITPDELQIAGNQVEAYGVDMNLSNYLLAHEDGPLIVKHLANNLGELEQLNGMLPQQQGEYIATHLKPKLEALKPRTTDAPEPPTQVKGGGTDPENGKYRYIAGATFE